MTREQTHKPPTEATLDAFVRIVGEDNAIRDAQAMAPYLVEWRDRYHGKAALVLKPGETEEVAAILTYANATRTAIVPQGGNTGLVGGQIPFESGHEVVVALERLNRVRDIDLASNTMTVEAGLVLAHAQQVASSAGRLFPLSLASEGSCQIGGALATNAGGTSVLAYGNARELTLGIEVVLADGRIWDGLKSLRKDNSGYDLKDLFIGSEGTLGIITAAVLRLFPKPAEKVTAMAGFSDLEMASVLCPRAGTRRLLSDRLRDHATHRRRVRAQAWQRRARSVHHPLQLVPPVRTIEPVRRRGVDTACRKVARGRIEGR